MNPPSTIRIGTRGSPLALAQTKEVRDRLTAAHPNLAAPEIVIIKTTGDAVLDRPLADIGGKGLFTKEIDEAMLSGSIDLAVHSMKDVPTWLPDGIVLPCMLAREDPRDAFISIKAPSLYELAAGSIVGTASLRRQAQILHRRPDLKVVSFRGNVQTRMKKLADGVVDATLLAVAGLNRLSMAKAATAILEPKDMLPAVAQGAVGITCRASDETAHRLLGPLNHPETFSRVACERALLKVLDGSCRTPIAALAEISGAQLWLRGLIASSNGDAVQKIECFGQIKDAESLGREGGEELKRRASPQLLKSLAKDIE